MLIGAGVEFIYEELRWLSKYAEGNIAFPTQPFFQKNSCVGNLIIEI
jgi:hypothetical protein